MGELVILQPGEKLASLDGIPGGFADWVLDGLGLSPQAALRVRLDQGEALPEVERVGALVITGSSAMVTDPHPWIEPGCDWLRQVAEAGRSILGLCFGHQMLAQAFGGLVDYNPAGIEVGTTRLSLTPAGREDPLLAPLRTDPRVHVSHWQSVLRLPPGAELLASSPLDPHQAFRLGDRIWGLQFHPEFSAAVVQGYLDYHLMTGGEIVARAPGLTQVADVHTGAAILRGFHALNRHWLD